MEATIEEILARVQVPDAAAARERGVAAVLDGLAASPKKRRRRRLFGFLLSIGAGGLIVVSPLGEAIADLFTGDNPPQLSPQDRALTRIACLELGADAAGTSWCYGVDDDAGANAVELLDEHGYMIDRVGPAMAIKSPDGTVMITGTDGLGPGDLPPDFGHRFNDLPEP